MKNSNDTTWDRTSDFTICSTTPSPLCYCGPQFLRSNSYYFPRNLNKRKKCMKSDVMKPLEKWKLQDKHWQYGIKMNFTQVGCGDNWGLCISNVETLG